MFIDDDEPTNVYHEIVLNSSEMCGEYAFLDSPFKALEYLKQAQIDVSLKTPDAIFLDVNMPKMDGWQFLDEYKNIKLEKSSTVVMLTTSLSPYDKSKVENYKIVQQMINKPLTEKILEDLHESIMKSN